MTTGIEPLIVALVANGLTSLIAHVGRSALVNERLLARMKMEEASLDSVLARAVESVSDEIPWKGPVRVEEVCLFLLSPEAETVVRQIYCASLLGRGAGKNLDSIREEFTASLSLHLDMDRKALLDSTQYLFNALVEGCEKALEVAIDGGVLSAHEAKSNFRYRIVLDELASMKKNLDLITGATGQDLGGTLAFERQYRDQVADRHAHIIPPHFDAARKVPIDDIYVSPQLRSIPREKNVEVEPLAALQFLSNMYRAVILGNPGSGKSTFALKVCHELAGHYAERPLAGRLLTPILVILRDYGADKSAHGYSILQFIEKSANSKYQVQPPQGSFEYLLLNGRLMVIFDGLDELLDTSYRLEVAGDVESFCSLYPAVPVLVTSREVGYEQAPLDRERFETFRLAPFEEDQVEEYVAKWFAVDDDLTSDQQRQKVSSFLEESAIVPDLRSNPLMLALMCNIYRGENYIPRNRPDVYEKCATMLFEKWDKSRGIRVNLPFEAHIGPALKYLAYWIYADKDLQRGVAERVLVTKAADYLTEWRFEDRVEAEAAACQFIEFCRGRAWVFSDAGLTPDGESIYQFTHRTFLEYFTAAHLARTHATSDELAEALLPKIEKQEWDVVAQLSFQIQNKNLEGAADKLLLTIIERAGRVKTPRSFSLLSFAARSLEFLVPTPRVARVVTEACVAEFMDVCAARYATGKSARQRQRSEPGEPVAALLRAASENHSTIADALERDIVRRVVGEEEAQAMVALEFAFNLGELPLHSRTHASGYAAVVDFGKEIGLGILEASGDRVVELCNKNPSLAMGCFMMDRVSLAEFVEAHGLSNVFRGIGSLGLDYQWMSMASILEGRLHGGWPTSRPSDDHVIDSLGELGRLLQSHEPPWAVDELDDSPYSDFGSSESHVVEWVEGLSPEALFGAFAVIAVPLEARAKEAGFDQKLASLREDTDTFFTERLRLTFIARFASVPVGEVQAELAKCGFTLDHQALLWRWIRREVDLVSGKAG